MRQLDSVFSSLQSCTPAQLEMLRTLEELGTAVTVMQVAKHTGLHINTVRETLEQVTKAGLVNKRVAPRATRGRPNVVYQLGAPNRPENFYQQVADLLFATARLIQDTAPDPLAYASEIGKRWGQECICRMEEKLAQLETESLEPAEVISRICVMLSASGFCASADIAHRRISLHSCPYLIKDLQLQPLICTIHGMMVRQIVQWLSEQTLTCELRPFVTRSRCDIHVLGSSPAEDISDTAENN